MAVLDFIKSLFIPKYMARHRFMPILVAICLFVVSTYLILLPSRYYYLHNAKKLVDNTNLYYLQAIRDIDRNAPVNDSIKTLDNEIASFGLYYDSGKIKANHLGLYDIEVSNDFLGYIEKKNNVAYYINGEDSGIVVSDKAKDYPTITSLDGKYLIDNVNDKPIKAPGLTEGEEIDVIKVSLVSSNSHLELDGVDTGILITSGKASISLDSGKFVVNGVSTTKEVTKKTLIYFVSRSTTYYEQDISYVNDLGVTQNIKFIIDLTKESISSSPFTIESTDVDYLNQDYYYVLICNSAVFYQAHLVGINDKKVERDGKALQCQAYNVFTSKLPFDLTDINPTDFPVIIYNYLIDGYCSLAISNFSLISLIYVVLFTLVISLLFVILFRRTGRMKKFKEYYNIASIANIVPILITFVVMWFNPAWFTVVYLVTFAIYYLFVLYKINNSSEMI